MRKSDCATSRYAPQTHLITILRACGRDTSAGAWGCSWGLGATNQLVLADLARTILDARGGRLKWIGRCNFGEFLRLTQYIEDNRWHESYLFALGADHDAVSCGQAVR